MRVKKSIFSQIDIAVTEKHISLYYICIVFFVSCIILELYMLMFSIAWLYMDDKSLINLTKTHENISLAPFIGS